MLSVALGVVLAGFSSPCVQPGICVPPATHFKSVLPMKPRKQWGNSGGFCGSNSIQMNALMFGNYLSQTQVRKATDHGEGHGNIHDGFEILPTNIEQALGNLALRYESFDYNQPKPQAPAYKRFLKKHLTRRHPVVWFVMCKGDGEQIPYKGSNPNGGRFSHIEAVWGFFTNHSLADDEVRGDDWLVHSSDWDTNSYHRRFDSLVDSPNMDGNCRNAQREVSRNEAYPCIYNEVDYGTAILGNVDPRGLLLPAVLQVDNSDEPNVTLGRPATDVRGTLTITALQSGASYFIYRYEGKENVPKDSVYENGKYAYKHPFTASSDTHVFEDPHTFKSDAAVFYRVVKQ